MTRSAKGPVKLPVHIRIPQNGLHVFAGFGETDGLDELLRISGPVPAGLPPGRCRAL
jgi:hypothetical protein